MSKVEVRVATVCSGVGSGWGVLIEGCGRKKKKLFCNLLEGTNVLWRKRAVPAAATGGLRDHGGDESRLKEIEQNQRSNGRARQLGLSSVWTLTLSSSSAIKAADV